MNSDDVRADTDLELDAESDTVIDAADREHGIDLDDVADAAVQEGDGTDGDVEADEPVAGLNVLTEDLEEAAAAVPAFEATPRGDDYLAYDLHTWALESRVMTESLLMSEEMAHAWEGTTLVVRTPDKVDVEGLLEEVAATERDGLDAEADRVAYEIAEWPVEYQTMFTAALNDNSIPFQFDSLGDLVVYEIDDPRVEKILEDLDIPDFDDDGEEVDGIKVHDILTQVFVAAERLKNNARDANGVLGMARAAEEAIQLGLPFGFDANGWRKFVTEADEMKSLLESDRSDDEEISELAGRIHARLRPVL